ncbi:MEDS domain-containing protein [Actinomadura kijaniata]|uniref:MEDS domain-containing protein n=1 Tax=Actinomadura kijaniata TaxID=46161 RepID=UPI003F1A04AD
MDDLLESLWSVERPVSELRPGDHAWLCYETFEEQSFVTVPFVDEGLARGHRVICLAERVGGPVPGLGRPPAAGPAPRVVALADLPGPVGPAVVLEALAKEIMLAEEQGCPVVRVTADMTWALRAPGGLEELLACERQLEDEVGPSTMVTAVCQFDRRRCGAEELPRLFATHSVRVVPDPVFDDPVLRIVRTFRPRGLALAGELDASRHTWLDEALCRVMEAGHGDVHLNMSGLRFIDLGALNLLAERAAERPAAVSSLVLDRIPAQLFSVVERVGWHMLPGLRLGHPS